MLVSIIQHSLFIFIIFYNGKELYRQTIFIEIIIQNHKEKVISIKQYHIYIFTDTVLLLIFDVLYFMQKKIRCLTKFQFSVFIF